MTPSEVTVDGAEISTVHFSACIMSETRSLTQVAKTHEHSTDYNRLHLVELTTAGSHSLSYFLQLKWHEMVCDFWCLFVKTCLSPADQCRDVLENKEEKSKQIQGFQGIIKSLSPTC